MVEPSLGRADDLCDAARDVDLLVIATPDDAVARVAARVAPVDSTVVAHLSGSLGTDVLVPHPRRAGLHPLVPLPDAAVGARRLRAGASFAVAGSDATALAMVGAAVAVLGGRCFEVADDARPAYHASAAVAANHVVALLGQVERVAATAGLPLDAYGQLVRAAVDDALALGPAAALTGPASRGDWTTLQAHRAVLAGLDGDGAELAAYDAMVAMARRLAAAGGTAAGAAAAGGGGGAADEPADGPTATEDAA
jgi:predicted short-subunit dehydrogenase-like oxidoreductase (DUF2520 family)